MHYAALVLLGSDVDPDDNAAVDERIADILEPYYSDREESDNSPYPGLWDWYEVGGRYAQRLIQRTGPNVDVARAGAVDWPAMSGKDREGRTYTVFTRESYQARSNWDAEAPADPTIHERYQPHDCAEGWCKGAWIETADFPEHWDALVAHLAPNETVAIVDYHN